MSIHFVTMLFVTMQGDHHIVCSAISTCGRWAAFSDVAHVSLFKLNLVSVGDKVIFHHLVEEPFITYHIPSSLVLKVFLLGLTTGSIVDTIKFLCVLILL